MNTILALGILIIAGYLSGRGFEKIGLPKIIAYIITGIVFSLVSDDLETARIIDDTGSLLAICLGFITFEVGGELKIKALKAHRKEIIYITLLASILPFVLIATAFYLIGVALPDVLHLQISDRELLVLSVLLGALASPTDPTATLAVIHQYKVKGEVKDTILGVAALDDSIGIILFSVVLAIGSSILGFSGSMGSAVLHSFTQIAVGILIGVFSALLLVALMRMLSISSEGRWIVFLFGMIALTFGFAEFVHADELLACMTMGMIVSNTSKHRGKIFRVLQRYSEELIFLLFFVISGLHLNVRAIPEVILLIFLFVILRTVGKYGGSYLGASMAGASAPIKKYTAGGLISQGGIVIGLALVVGKNSVFEGVSEILLAVIMGVVVIHELIGPITAKHSFKKSKEMDEGLDQ